MLNATNRFHGHGSLRYLYRNGTPVRSRFITLKAVENRRRNQARIAVVVSKKTLKSAVGRNRIRRRVYEVLRHELDSIDPVYDIVLIITSAEVRILPPLELYAEVKQSLIRAGVYKSNP